MDKKKLIIGFLIGIISHIQGSENTECIGNIQDAPITNFQNTPLKGWTAFAVNFPNSFSKHTSKKIVTLIKDKLSSIGKLIETEAPDVVGLGMSANVLNLEVDKLCVLGNKNPNLVRISLNLQTNTTINKTQEECAAYVWTSNVFIEGNLEDSNEKNMLAGVENLLTHFTTCYKESNPERVSQPKIYFYN